MENQSQTKSYTMISDLVRARVVVDDNFKLIKPIWGLTQVQFQDEQDAIRKLDAASTNHYSTLKVA